MQCNKRQSLHSLFYLIDTRIPEKDTEYRSRILPPVVPCVAQPLQLINRYCSTVNCQLASNLFVNRKSRHSNCHKWSRGSRSGTCRMLLARTFRSQPFEMLVARLSQRNRSRCLFEDWHGTTFWKTDFPSAGLQATENVEQYKDRKFSLCYPFVTLFSSVRTSLSPLSVLLPVVL